MPQIHDPNPEQSQRRRNRLFGGSSRPQKECPYQPFIDGSATKKAIAKATRKKGKRRRRSAPAIFLDDADFQLSALPFEEAANNSPNVTLKQNTTAVVTSSPEVQPVMSKIARFWQKQQQAANTTHHDNDASADHHQPIISPSDDDSQTLRHATKAIFVDDNPQFEQAPSTVQSPPRSSPVGSLVEDEVRNVRFEETPPADCQKTPIKTAAQHDTLIETAVQRNEKETKQEYVPMDVPGLLQRLDQKHRVKPGCRKRRRPSESHYTPVSTVMSQQQQSTSPAALYPPSPHEWTIPLTNPSPFQSILRKNGVLNREAFRIDGSLFVLPVVQGHNTPTKDNNSRSCDGWRSVHHKSLAIMVSDVDGLDRLQWEAALLHYHASLSTPVKLTRFKNYVSLTVELKEPTTILGTLGDVFRLHCNYGMSLISESVIAWLVIEMVAIVGSLQKVGIAHNDLGFDSFLVARRQGDNEWTLILIGLGSKSVVRESGDLASHFVHDRFSMAAIVWSFLSGGRPLAFSNVNGTIRVDGMDWITNNCFLRGGDGWEELFEVLLNPKWPDLIPKQTLRLVQSIVDMGRSDGSRSTPIAVQEFFDSLLCHKAGADDCIPQSRQKFSQNLGISPYELVLRLQLGRLAQSTTPRESENKGPPQGRHCNSTHEEGSLHSPADTAIQIISQPKMKKQRIEKKQRPEHRKKKSISLSAQKRASEAVSSILLADKTQPVVELDAQLRREAFRVDDGAQVTPRNLAAFSTSNSKQRRLPSAGRSIHSSTHRSLPSASASQAIHGNKPRKLSSAGASQVIPSSNKPKMLPSVSRTHAVPKQRRLSSAGRKLQAVSSNKQTMLPSSLGKTNLPAAAKPGGSMVQKQQKPVLLNTTKTGETVVFKRRHSAPQKLLRAKKLGESNRRLSRRIQTRLYCGKEGCLSEFPSDRGYMWVMMIPPEEADQGRYPKVPTEHAKHLICLTCRPCQEYPIFHPNEVLTVADKMEIDGWEKYLFYKATKIEYVKAVQVEESITL